MSKRNMWRNLPLSIKIFLSYSVLLVVSCSVFAVSVYVQMSQAANNRILDSLRTMTGQSAYELNTILENMETQARLFAENDVVRTQTMLIYTDGYEDPVERYNGYRSMEQMIFSFSDHPDLHSVSLAFAKSSLFFRDQIHYLWMTARCSARSCCAAAATIWEATCPFRRRETAGRGILPISAGL